MTDFNDLVERYIATWNEGDPEVRVKAIAQLWTEDGSYTDPLAAVTGHEAISAVIGGARDMFPGFTFKALEGVDSHHDILRFRWELLPPTGGESIVIGFDVASVTEDGRIRAVYGFLDKVPTG